MFLMLISEELRCRRHHSKSSLYQLGWPANLALTSEELPQAAPENPWQPSVGWDRPK